MGNKKIDLDNIAVVDKKELLKTLDEKNLELINNIIDIVVKAVDKVMHKFLMDFARLPKEERTNIKIAEMLKDLDSVFEMLKIKIKPEDLK